MNPGRELDALVAEKVMRWSKLIGDLKFETYWIGTDPLTKCNFQIPNYSTDIAAAWEVVEKMRSLRNPVRIFSDQTHKRNLWVVMYMEREFGTMIGMSTEETLPHAICLAALKAMEAK